MVLDENLGVDGFMQMTPARYLPAMGLRPGGERKDIVPLVSALYRPLSTRAASFCVTNLGWTLEEVSAADDLHRWAVLRTSAVADTRPFDYYVEF